MFEKSKHMLIQETYQGWRLRRGRKENPECFGNISKTHSFKLKEKFKNKQHHQKLHITKAKCLSTLVPPNLNRFLTYVFVWLYREKPSYFTFLIVTCSNPVYFFCVIFCVLAQQQTQNPYSMLTYRDLVCGVEKQYLENSGKCRAKHYSAQESQSCPCFKTKIYFDVSQTSNSASNQSEREYSQNKRKGQTFILHDCPRI